MYTDEKWMSVDIRVIRHEEGGGRERYAWKGSTGPFSEDAEVNWHGSVK